MEIRGAPPMSVTLEEHSVTDLQAHGVLKKQKHKPFLPSAKASTPTPLLHG